MRGWLDVVFGSVDLTITHHDDCDFITHFGLELATGSNGLFHGVLMKTNLSS